MSLFLHLLDATLLFYFIFFQNGDHSVLEGLAGHHHGFSPGSAFSGFVLQWRVQEELRRDQRPGRMDFSSQQAACFTYVDAVIRLGLIGTVI